MQAWIFYTKTTGQPNDPLIYETVLDEPMTACDEIYRQFNRVDGTEISIKKYERRSMCKGDLVYFPELKDWFLCASQGWLKVSLEFAREWLSCIEFKDAMMGLDWILENKPQLARFRRMLLGAENADGEATNDK